MKTINKVLCSVIVLALCMSMVAGCGTAAEKQATTQVQNETSEQPKTTVSTDVPKEKVKIQFYNWSPPRLKYLNPLVEKFNQDNKDSIEVEIITKTGDWKTPLKTAIVAGMIPDVMQSVPDFNEAIANKWITSWDENISDTLKNKVKGSEYMISVNQKKMTFAFAWSNKTYRLGYNKTIFKEAGISAPPTDWNEFRDIAKKITEKGAGKYYGAAIPLAKVGLEFWISPILAQEGIYQDLCQDYSNNCVNISPLAPYIQIWRDMYNEKVLFPGCETMDNDAVRAQFAADKVGMLMLATWDAALNTSFKTNCDWAVAPFLKPLGTQKGGLVIRDSYNYCLSAQSKDKNAVGKFLEDVLLSDNYLSDLYANGVDDVPYTSAREAAKSKMNVPEQWAGFSPVQSEVTGYGTIAVAAQLEGDNFYQTAQKLVILPDLDINKELADYNARAYDGIIKKAQIDAKKTNQSDIVIDSIGKIPVIEGYDPMKSVDSNNVKYLSVEEWKLLRK